MKVIVCMNNKGGVGKTTTVNNTAAYLRSLGFRVLLIDCDPQANTSSLYSPTIDNSFYDLLNGVAIEDCLENDLIKADESVALIEQLVSQGGYEYRLKKQLKKVEKHYDYCLIDLPPLFGVALRNALLVCDGVIIPAEATEFAAQGVQQTLDYIEQMNEAYSINVNVLGILLVRCKERSNEQKEIRSKIEEILEGKTKLFNSYISESTKVDECQKNKCSLYSAFPTEKVTIQYMSFCEELLCIIDSSYKTNILLDMMNKAKLKEFDTVTVWINILSIDNLIAMQESFFEKSYSFNVIDFIKDKADEERIKMILFFIAAYRRDIMPEAYFKKVFNSRYNYKNDNSTFLKYCFTEPAGGNVCQK